jgi:hypothetical protein
MAGARDEVAEMWAAILSEKRDKVLRAWRGLDGSERPAVMGHLERMADPIEGYAEVQQRAAKAALEILRASAS